MRQLVTQVSHRARPRTPDNFPKGHLGATNNIDHHDEQLESQTGMGNDNAWCKFPIHLILRETLVQRAI